MLISEDDRVGLGSVRAGRLSQRRMPLPLTIADMPEFRKQTIGVRRVFYSWQSDLPNATNRGLIGEALGAALTELASVGTTAVEPAPDRDTQGVAGAPDIAATIFEKIDAAAVFVADVSLVTPLGSERPAPNPNVLIELGYAMRALGPCRIVLVCNEHFGRVEQLPFDLRARRVLTYTNDPDLAERAVARRTLTASLNAAVARCLEEAALATTALPDIRIELSRVVELGKPDTDLLKVAVQNHSAQPLFISSITFDWASNGGLSIERDVTGRINSGGKVDPGDSYDWFVPVDVLKESEAERQQPFETAAVHDRVGNVHRSAPGELRRVLNS